MGIQVHRALVKQRAHALGALRRSVRKGAGADVIAKQQQLVDAFDLVLAEQGLDIEYDRDHAIEPRPKKQFFPKGAYRRDTLNILRRAQRPMRISEILEALCEMHGVTLSANGRLRDEFLNVNQFITMHEVHEKLRAWQDDYNHCRPHGSLGHLTPSEFATMRSGQPREAANL